METSVANFVINMVINDFPPPKCLCNINLSQTDLSQRMLDCTESQSENELKPVCEGRTCEESEKLSGYDKRYIISSMNDNCNWLILSCKYECNFNQAQPGKPSYEQLV